MNKSADRFLHLLQNPRWSSEVKGKKLANFGPTNHLSAPHLDPIHLIWTKCAIDILLYPRNKPKEISFIYCKSKMAARARGQSSKIGKI